MVSQTSQIQTRTVEIKAQGHLLTVKPEGRYIGKNRRGDRRETNEFTARSRTKLLRTFARIKAPDSKGYRSKVSMVTLTMRDIVHPRKAKQYLFTFLKRWRRKYPTLAGIWKLEFQKRGAPHFHMLLYNAGYISKDAIRISWGEIIGQDRPFTRIERIKNYRQGMAYVAKYLGKVDNTGFNYGTNLTAEETRSDNTEESIGRRWGVFNRFWIPFDDVIIETVPLDGSWWVIRKYATSIWKNLEEHDYNGFSLFVENPEETLKYMVSLSKQFRATKS